ncbi:hypothetical protein [Moorena sp. SIO4A5]
MGKKETPQEINNLGNQEILGNHRKGQLDVHDREGKLPALTCLDQNPTV